jgi:hypothetical protein
MSSFRIVFLVSIVTLLAIGQAMAHDPLLVADAADATDLKFRDMFKLPVGARGLEPSPKLLRLDGARVRIVGYMVDQEPMRSFILAPLPLKLGDEDESLADDLPPGVVFVHIAGQGAPVYRHVPGLLELSGILGVGSFAEADGRVATVRLTLYPTLPQEVSRHVPR